MINDRINKIIPLRHSAKRYKCHQFFTRQTWNVVQEFIKNFSEKGDIVYDPFCGSGVTPIEAFLLQRAGVGTDLSPHAIKISEGLINLGNTDVDWGKLRNIWDEILEEVEKLCEAKKDNDELSVLDSFYYPREEAINGCSSFKSVKD